jgi:hypothetical protein
MITENGMDILNQNASTTYNEAYNDDQRIYYYSSYLDNIAQAVKTSGINFIGYMPWSLLDNFEWSNAYTCRFGLFYLNCNSGSYIPSLPKKSVFWFKYYISTHPYGPTPLSSTINTSCIPYNYDTKSNTPWTGGPIRGYYYWSNNFYLPPYSNVNQTNTLNCLNTLTQIQNDNYTSRPPELIDFTQSSYNINYPSLTNNAPDIINGTNFNAIFIFTQYTRYSDIAANANLSAMYLNATNYFTKNNINEYLIGICFGGGWGNGYPNNEPRHQPGAFTKSDALYHGTLESIYTAITPVGVSYSYIQDNGFTVNIVGAGNITYSTPALAATNFNVMVEGQCNCLVFDIELGDVTANEFKNLFSYIKYLYPQMIIITAISHTCAYWDPENKVTQEIIQSNLSDYICPIMYSQMFGTVTEYLSNGYLPWENFFNLLQNNSNFIKYGLNYLLPNIYTGYPFTYNGTTILDNYKNGGTNNNNPPNNYYYQSTSNELTPVIESDGGDTGNIGYFTNDTGVIDFMNATLKYFNINTNISISKSLGGFIQWNNYQST